MNFITRAFGLLFFLGLFTISVNSYAQTTDDVKKKRDKAIKQQQRQKRREERAAKRYAKIPEFKKSLMLQDRKTRRRMKGTYKMMKKRSRRLARRNRPVGRDRGF
jgi:hypothetical protein